MVARGAGDVGCAHCTLIGADRACQVCTRMVCATCAADWTTCGEPSGRVVRLGLTARVRDVDPTGRLAFVTHWRQKPRLFDLRQLRWVRDIQFARSTYVWNRAHPPRLTSAGRLIHGDWSWQRTGDGSARIFDGMRVHSLRDRTSWLIPTEVPQRSSAVSAVGDYFYFVTDTEKVGIVHGAESYVVEPLPRKVVQAAYIEGERDLLAAASWSEVALCGLVDGRLAPLSRRKTETAGDVKWIAVAGAWLIAVVKMFGGPVVVEVWRLDRDFTIGALADQHMMSELHAAAVSRDGRYIALAGSDGLHVHELGADKVDLGADRVDVFTEHTDQINYVRFASDHTLISADTDNRVVMRPRAAAGYVRPVIAIDVPEEGVELPAPAAG
jgi:hypothetical protein